MTNEKTKEKIQAHWSYLNEVIKLAFALAQKLPGLSWEDIEPIVEKLYVSAMEHGYKHAMEDNK